MRYKFRQHPSRLATLMVTFGAGSRVEFGSKYPSGIAHYMEHVRFKGSDKFTSKELSKKVADVGGHWNAWTSNNMVTYFTSMPEENLETAFECLSEVALAPIFPEHELVKEKEVVCQEVRMNNDYLETLVYNKLIKNIFSNSLSFPIVGTEDSVRSINRQHLVDFNKDFYSKEHMLVSLASNSDHIDLMEKYFGIADDTLLVPPFDQNTQYGPSTKHIVNKEGQLQNIISLTFAGPELKKYQDEYRAKLKLFSIIFGQGGTSRLFTKIREDLGLVYGVSAYLHNHMDGSFFEIGTETEPENSEKVIEAAKEEIKKFLTDTLPTQEELLRAKNAVKSSLYGMLDSSSNVIHQMVNEEFFGYKSVSEYLADIEATNLNDISEAAHAVFDSTNEYLIIGTGK